MPVTSIATSTGQNDAGVFEFNFRDERYLPFEGAGAISQWLLELGGANYSDSDENEVLRQFDYSTISDVILHFKYTAREGGGTFKNKAISYLIDEFIPNSDGLADQPFMRLFSLRHEFPNEWHKFLYPATEGGKQVLSFTIGKERFPFFVQQGTVVVMKIEVFAKCTGKEDYDLTISYFDDSSNNPTTSTSTIKMAQNNNYGEIRKATINTTDAGLDLEKLDITREMCLQIKNTPPNDYKELSTDEVDDILLVLHYKIG